MFSHANTLLVLAASASAHMIMTNPVPFGVATLNNSPLEPADFPCKQRAGMYTEDVLNQWEAGETKTITFKGSAVHGGGSCQFSITTDQQPDAQSQWKVIHSVIGNCLTDIDDNLPGGPDALGSKGHSVAMPSDIPNGKYTFAWTWLNRKGNREFYMNCAPIEVSGSSNSADTASTMSALPDMFVANLPSKGENDCSTTAEKDFVYPNPGQSVERGNVGVRLDDTLTGSGCATQTKMGAGSGQIGSPSPGTPSTPSQGTPEQPKPSEQPAASPSQVYDAPQQSKIPSNPGGGMFAPGASSAPAAGPTAGPSPPASKPTTPAASPLPPTVPETPKDEPPKAPDNNNTTPVSGECTPCTNDGAIVCIGSNQFGLCNRGCAVAQDLAAGMACSEGVVVAATKRHVHFPRAHLHRRFSAARLI